jgi:glycosyltransferase involved in cell wall biosynthesis
MRILFFPEYDTRGASSRYRIYQYLPYLSEAGIYYEVSFLFGNSYLTARYADSKKFYLLALLCYIKRVFSFFRAFKFDLIVIEKELFPYMPAYFEWILKVSGKKYIVDYDDAIFHNYDLNRNRLLKYFLRNKIKNVIKYSSAVIVGNNYLYEYAVKWNNNVIKLPTVVSYNAYNSVRSQKNDNEFTIGWIGSPTSSHYLLPFIDVFRKLQQPDVKFKFIGADKKIQVNFKDISADWIEWNPETEIADIKSFSVGIMPLDDTPWSRGKCGFKIIQYMACGIPVVASSVGANREIVINNSTGFLAETMDDWFICLSKLSKNIALQKTMGEAGFSLFKDKYSVEILKTNYLKILNS